MKKKTPKNTDKKYCTVSIGIIVIFLLSFLLDNIVVNMIISSQINLLFNFFYYITILGEVYVFVWIALILLGILIIYRKKYLTFAATAIIAPIIVYVLKSIINRPRPFETLHITSSIQTSMSSFPSGHALMFFAIIPIMSKSFPKIKWVFWTIAILVGVSRVYLGVHYLSDVVGGAIIGYGIGVLLIKIGEKYEWKY